MSTPDRVLDALTRRQHGAFSRPQAVTAGFTARMIERRVATGVWIRLDYGVYALPSHPFSWERQAMAATLSAPGAVLSGRAAAAALHAIEGFSKGSVEITVPRSARNTRSRLATVRSARVIRRSTVRGIPCLPISHLPVSMADQLSVRRLEVLVDEILVHRRATIEQLLDPFVIFAASRSPGTPALRSVLVARSGEAYVPPTSELERLAFAMWDHPSTPVFERQVELPWWPPGEGIVDGYAASCTLIGEGDGRAWHTRERDFVNDRRRDNLAAANGHQVLRFSYADLRYEPAWCREVVRRTALARGWMPPSS